jgi:transposase
LGTYFIRTTLKKSEEETIWKLYRTINEVEDAFKTLKSDLNTRPNYHQLEKNIEAHINLSVLSYNIINMIRHRLKLKDLHYGWSRIRSIMSTQHITLQAINGRDKKTVWIKSCTRPQANVYEIYAALNYKNMPYYRKSIIVE